MKIGSIEELVKYVNEQLKTGLSTAQIEKNMEVGKDTVRKKLNRAGYKFNRDVKQFIKQDKKAITQDNINNTNKLVYNITRKNTSVITPNNIDNTNDKKEVITHKNTYVIEENNIFSNEEIKLLKDILQEYKNRKKTKELELDNVIIDSNVITRSFRSYKIVLDNFADYCKENNLNQKDAIAVALTDFMKNY